MTEHTLAPIELNDDELLAVSGGRASAHASSAIVQTISQSVGVAQLGGDVSVGGNGATSLTNATNASFTETFSAITTTTQSASNSNTGSATSTATLDFSYVWSDCTPISCI